MPKLFCTCGSEVSLVPVGGQYQNSWRGVCVCGRMWDVTDYREDLFEAEPLPEFMSITPAGVTVS